MAERSHRPLSHPRRHSAAEEEIIRAAYREKFYRYGWDGTYAEAIKYGYGRSLSGMVYAARRMGICMADSKAKPPGNITGGIRSCYGRERRCRSM